MDLKCFIFSSASSAHTYIFVFEAKYLSQVLEIIDNFACNDDLPMTHQESEMLQQMIREVAKPT